MAQAWPQLGAVRDRARKEINELVPGFFTDAMFNRWINAGIDDVAAKTHCIKSIDAISVSGRATAFSGYAVKTVLNSDGISLHKSNLKRMGHSPVNSPSPQFWCQWGQFLVVDPVPATATTLTVYIADYATALSSDTDQLGTTAGLPNEVHELVFDYTLWMAHLRDRQYAAAAGIYMMYSNKCLLHRSFFDKKYADRQADQEIPDRIVIAQPQ